MADFFGIATSNWQQTTYSIVRGTFVLLIIALVSGSDLHSRSLRLFSRFDPTWLALITRSKISLRVESSSPEVSDHYKRMNWTLNSSSRVIIVGRGYFFVDHALKISVISVQTPTKSPFSRSRIVCWTWYLNNDKLLSLCEIYNKVHFWYLSTI